MTLSTPASTLTDDQIDEAQSECDAFLCDNCDIRIHQFAREIERLVRATPPAIPDRNLEGAGEFVTALMLGQPIWPNAWGQDVAAAAFFLTDNGKRSTALSTPAAVEVSEPVGLLRRATDLHEKAFMPFDQAVELAMSERGLSMPLYQAVGKLVCHIGYEGSIEAAHDLVDEVMGALHAIDGGTPPEAAASVQGFDPTAEQTAHDEWWESKNMSAEFSLMTMNQSRAAWREGVRRALATPVVQGEPVAPIKCALCGDKARIPPTCDACHDSMGTRATLATRGPIGAVEPTDEQIKDCASRHGVAAFGGQFAIIQFVRDILALRTAGKP